MMNAKQLLEWMRKPGMSGREDGAQLDSLLQSYPYFQTAHLLYIKNLHNQGSFLYNNQLKSAAIYVADRKVLYDLIKRKDAVEPVEETTVSKVEIALPVEEQKQEIKSAPPKFPEKRFVSNPDEWEAGMLRQLQLLHHWRGKEKEEVKPKEEIHPIANTTPAAEQKEVPNEVLKHEIPDAKDELNTLLYVLVEPGQSEDIGEELSEEPVAEIENTTAETKWEIHPVEDSKEEKEEAQVHVEVPQDPVQQDILVEAIHSVFELEADDKLPDVSELKTVSENTINSEIEKPLEPVKEEQEINIGEMSFATWVASLKQNGPVKQTEKQSIAEQKAPVSSNGEELIERFIKEEPRIQVKKSGFFNPVNMAKKSVQESDEFITETLARIYAKQGNIPKAIRAYQKLSLKFPEKTAYFAALIEELKRTPNK
ncbi:MAG: hypothetical protein L6Q81_08930 [Bacteroidia bacterium]|nr:hypothetical protein [Bacteroidia bacterium]